MKMFNDLYEAVFKAPSKEEKIKNKIDYIKKSIKIRDSKYEYDDDLDLSHWDLKSLLDFPYQFSKVNGLFNCSDNQLTSLKGCPEIVENFSCTNNQLKNLQYSPKKIDGWYDCSDNQLVTLKGCTEIIFNVFDCAYNQLTSLEDGPKAVKKGYYCQHNQLTSLKGMPQEIYGNVDCSYNQLSSLEFMPKIIFGNFNCINNTKQFTIDEIKKHSKITGNILV